MPLELLKLNKMQLKIVEIVENATSAQFNKNSTSFFEPKCKVYTPKCKTT